MLPLIGGDAPRHRAAGAADSEEAAAAEAASPEAEEAEAARLGGPAEAEEAEAEAAPRPRAAGAADPEEADAAPRRRRQPRDRRSHAAGVCGGASLHAASLVSAEDCGFGCPAEDCDS